MVLRANERAAYVAIETTFATDPSPSGASYLWIPGKVGLPKNTQSRADISFSTGRALQTPPEAVADGAALEIEHPLYGLSAAAGDLTAPPAEDFFSRLLRAALGARLTQSGRNVAAGSTTSNLVLASAAWTDQNLASVYQAALLSPDRSEVRRLVLSSGATYNLAGGNWTTAPGATAVAYGGEMYAPDEDNHPSIAVHVRGDVTGAGGQVLSRTLLGGGVTSLKLSAQLGQPVRLSYGLEFDRDLDETKASLPTVGVGPGYLSVKPVLAALTLNGTAYSFKSCEIDFGIDRKAQGAQDAANGRNSWELVTLKPKMTITPLHDNAFRTLKKADTDVAVLAKFGSGVLAGGRVNSSAFFAPSCRILGADQTDDDGDVRDSLELSVYDAGILTGTTLQRSFTFARF